MNTQIAREAAASARSHPIASLLTIVTIIAMVTTVMLTTGRSAATGQTILDSIASPEGRAIRIQASPAAHLTSDVITSISTIQGIQWAGAFTPALDATNQANPDGNRLPLRQLYATSYSELGIPTSPSDDLAWASPQAMTLLGLLDKAGAITVAAGPTYGIAGQLIVPAYLAGYQPLLVIPHSNQDPPQPVTTIIIIAASPNLITPVSQAVLSVLPIDDPSTVTIETSAQMVALRAVIEGQLSASSRSLILSILAITIALIGVLQYALVMMQRKDYGRRRALGATRGFIITLILTQTTILALIGITLALVISATILLINHNPLPDARFTAAIAILATTAALIAAATPAIVASHRDPATELRVP